MAKKEEKKDRKRAALLALSTFQKHLEKTCGRYKEIKEWQSMIIDKLDPLLSEFEDAIPEKVRDRLKKASSVDEDTSAGINKTCKILKSEVGRAMKVVSPGGGLGGLVVKGLFIAGAIGVGIAVIGLKSSSVAVVIKNSGCSSIQPPPELPVKIPGFKLPTQTIFDGGEATARVPAVTAQVNTDAAGNVTISVLGVTNTIRMGEGVEVFLNGQSIRGRNLTVNLKDQKQHELVIRCG